MPTTVRSMEGLDPGVCSSKAFSKTLSVVEISIDKTQLESWPCLTRLPAGSKSFRDPSTEIAGPYDVSGDHHPVVHTSSGQNDSEHAMWRVGLLHSYAEVRDSNSLHIRWPIAYGPSVRHAFNGDPATVLLAERHARGLDKMAS